jgi:magnesium-dependent phosphatase 1
MTKFSLSDGKYPELVVFDLDWTIWPFDCDKDVIAPFTNDWQSIPMDSYGRPVQAYTDACTIIAALIDAKIPVAYLSRNPNYYSVKALLEIIKVPSTLNPHATLYSAMPSPDYLHAYSSNGYPGRGKAKHFAALKQLSGVNFSDMLFFDDMEDNISAAIKQGTPSVRLLNNKGLTMSAFNTGLEMWRTQTLQKGQ